MSLETKETVSFMDAPRIPAQARRNKGFEETHRELIETAVRMISERGVDSLSIAALAREMQINRTTIYYHFESREALLDAVADWATGQLEHGMDDSIGQPDRIAHISRFVLANPELIKLWIDEFVSGKDIRDSYTHWDEMIAGVQSEFDARFPEDGIDAAVYCTMMLSAAIIGPRVFANKVAPDMSHDEITERFLREHLRVLRRDGLFA